MCLFERNWTKYFFFINLWLGQFCATTLISISLPLIVLFQIRLYLIIIVVNQTESNPFFPFNYECNWTTILILMYGIFNEFQAIDQWKCCVRGEKCEYFTEKKCALMRKYLYTFDRTCSVLTKCRKVIVCYKNGPPRLQMSVLIRCVAQNENRNEYKCWNTALKRLNHLIDLRSLHSFIFFCENEWTLFLRFYLSTWKVEWQNYSYSKLFCILIKTSYIWMFIQFFGFNYIYK